MNKFKLAALILSILFITVIIFFLEDKKKIQNQNEEIAELENKVQSLERKVSELESDKEELESDKEELENQISQLSEDDKANRAISTIPIYQSNSPQTYSDNSQSVLGKGYAFVVYKQSSCDYFILDNGSGYIVAEWMGGNDPEMGDKITGDFNSFGIKDFYNQSRERNCKLWIDGYLLSIDRVLEEIRDKCN